MSFKVRCQQCGKVSQFSASDAGLTALCVACGTRFTIPAQPDEPAPQDSLQDVAALLPGETSDDATVAAAAALSAALGHSAVPVRFPGDDSAAGQTGGGESAAGPRATGGDAPRASMPAKASAAAITPPPIALRQPATPAPPRGGFSFALLYTLLGSLLTSAVILAVILVGRAKPTWDDQHRAPIRDLKAKAEAYTVDQRFREAYDTYRKIDQMVAGHEIVDAQLRSDVEQARAQRDELFKTLFGQMKQQYSTVTLPQETHPPVPKPATTHATENGAGIPAASQAWAAAPDWPEYHPRRLTTQLAIRHASTAPTRPSPTTTSAKASAAASTVHPMAPASKPVTQPTVAAAVDHRPGVDPKLPPVVRPPITVQPGRQGAVAASGLTDEAIGRAIQGGANFLIGRFVNGRLHGGTERRDAYYTGLDALCVYALLQSAYAIKDDRLNLKGPFVRDMVEKMKAMPADLGPVTYARAIRATALALLARPEDKPAISADLAYLLSSHVGGAYTYSKNGGRAVFSGGGWDNSNSQYGLLGVWSAAEIGAEVNTSYWQAVENHWTRCQNANGTWDYAGFGRNGDGRISMTVAGIASLFVTHDYLDAPKIGSQVGREPFSKALQRGLDYLEFNDNSVNLSGGYTLYGLERVGLASGFKFFGEHDWYRELAAAVINAQEGDGSWGTEIETAYHLLFLARGRHPILMNKLRFDGHWANRPRDVANLARFGSREMERPLNWQVVPLSRDWTDWADSPILYLASHKREQFTPDEIEKIRNYVLAGGMLFTQADGGEAQANEWLEELARKLFPDYEMKDLPDDHEIYSVLYKPSPRPRLRAVSNGARILMLHSPTDITQYWQMRQDKSRRSLFELGMNIFLYAAGKGDLRNRLASTYVPPQGPATGGSIGVVRLKYPGNWDPEPLAWGRFARVFQRDTDVALSVVATDIENLNPNLGGFAHWTGTGAYTPTAAQIAAIRKFVQAGGVLMVEPCGGNGDFYESARLALAKAFPEVQPQLLPRTHPILAASGPGMDDLATPQVRAYVKTRGYGTGGRLDAITFGRGKVILNPLDLTTGLLGCNNWGVLGFEPAYAQSLMKNLLIWSATGMKEQ
ncbi:MAG TPA: DUF4159 domain-containing protein [Tepidisphaeraceae bacterium]|jgi:hypothetical protein